MLSCMVESMRKMTISIFVFMEGAIEDEARVSIILRLADF